MTNKRAADIINEIIFNYNWHSLTEWKKAALKHAVSVLEKENEPAPSANDTSSGTQNKFLHLHDSTESIICQALKYGKLAAETGATITYSGGVFIIAPRVGEQK